jgi:hypothetical protein
LFIPEIPSSSTYQTSSSTLSLKMPQDLTTHLLHFQPYKMTLTLDRYTTMKQLKKEILKFFKNQLQTLNTNYADNSVQQQRDLLSFYIKWYQENALFLFESISPSKKVKNSTKMVKFLRDQQLLNTIGSNHMILAYALACQAEETTAFGFVHLVSLSLTLL